MSTIINGMFTANSFQSHAANACASVIVTAKEVKEILTLSFKLAFAWTKRFVRDTVSSFTSSAPQEEVASS